MLRFKLTVAFASGILLFAIVGAGRAQNKPLKKIRGGVPSVRVGNIMIFVS